MLVTDAQVRTHLRIDADEDVSVYVSAAERAVQQFMNRSVYADQASLDDARAQAPVALSTAMLAYDTAVAAANAIENGTERDMALFAAKSDYEMALSASRQAHLGMVVNDDIRASILLITGHLYANRENVVVGASVAELPMGSLYLLQPYRCQMGV